jgi:hypothetical protein
MNRASEAHAGTYFPDRFHNWISSAYFPNLSNIGGVIQQTCFRHECSAKILSSLFLWTTKYVVMKTN